MCRGFDSGLVAVKPQLSLHRKNTRAIIISVLYVIVGTHNILSVEIVSFRVGPRRHHRHPGRNGVDDRSSSDVSGVDLHRATGHVRGVLAGQERDAGRDIDWVGTAAERRLSTHDRLLRFGVPLVGYHRVDYAWTDRASPMPALLNRASIPPQVSATASKHSSNRSLSLMSSGRNSAVPSAAVIRLDPLDGLLAPVNVDIGNGDVDARLGEPVCRRASETRYVARNDCSLVSACHRIRLIPST